MVGGVLGWSLVTSAWNHSQVVSRFVRKVRTSSGAVAVQIVTRRGRQTERVEHLGSAHTDSELALLLSAARARLSPGQDALDLGDLAAAAPRIGDVAGWTAGRRAGQAMLGDAVPAASAGGRPVSVNAGSRVVATSSQLLWQVLTDAYARLGLDVLADEAFRAMVLARIVEPASKADSLRVLAGLGAPALALRTLFRSLARCRMQATGTGSQEPARRSPRPQAGCRRWRNRRRHHAPLRDGRRRNVAGWAAQGRDEQGAPRRSPGPGRAARGSVRVPARGAPVRGQHRRDHHLAAGPACVPGTARPDRDGRRGRCRDAVRGEP